MLLPFISWKVVTAFLASLLIWQGSAFNNDFKAVRDIASSSTPSTDSETLLLYTATLTTFLTSTTATVEAGTTTVVLTSVTSSPLSKTKTVNVLSTITSYVCTTTSTTTSTTTFTPPPATHLRRAMPGPLITPSSITTTTVTGTTEVTSTATSLVTISTSTTRQAASVTVFTATSTLVFTQTLHTTCTSTVVATATACVRGNLIRDPGFESGTLDAYEVTSLNDGGESLIKGSSLAHSGNFVFGQGFYSAAPQPDPIGTSVLIQSNIPVSPNNTYTFEAYVKMAVMIGKSIQCNFSMDVNDMSTGDVIGSSHVVYASDVQSPTGYSLVRYSFDTQATTEKAYVSLVTSCKGGIDSVELYIDDLNLSCTS